METKGRREEKKKVLPTSYCRVYFNHLIGLLMTSLFCKQIPQFNFIQNNPRINYLITYI
jgi:hypothetical protein